MGKYRLDDMEADEVYHALCDRKELLEKRKKDLLEKDGLAEASEAVDVRLRLYITDGDSVGLIRLFAPQRDAFAQRERERQKRDANGGADLFGGGVETGGGHPAGETVKAAYDNAKPGDKVVVGVAIVKGDGGPAPADVAGAEDVTDVTPISGKRQRRLGSGPKQLGSGNPANDPPEPPRPLA